MSGRVAKFLLEMIQGRNQRIFLGATKPMSVGIIRCGHVVRDFESEAKTRSNFQF